MGSWLESIVRRKKSNRGKTTSSDKVPSKDKPRNWTLWKSSSDFKKGLAQNGSQEVEVIVSKKETDEEYSQEERAAIRIQTAFRGFLARRALRALKALACLRATINGRRVREQSLASLRPIRDFVRIQAQIHEQRALKRQSTLGGPQKHPGNTMSPCTVESEAEWCDATGTLEEIHARVQQRRDAAAKRERALAYAFSNQWRANSSFNSDYFLDYELDNSTWSWIWLDRWISGVNDSSKERSKQESKDSWIRGVNDSSKVKTNKESKMKTKEQNTRKKVVLKRPAPVLAKKRVHSKVVDTIKEQ